MTNANEPPLGPRSGNPFWMAATDVSSLANKEAAADALVGHCTTSLPFKFEFDPKENGHYLMFSATREGMLGMASRPSLLPLSAPTAIRGKRADGAWLPAQLAGDGRDIADSPVPRALGMESKPEGERRVLDVLQQLKRLVPVRVGMRYSEADGVVRAGDVYQ